MPTDRNRIEKAWQGYSKVLPEGVQLLCVSKYYPNDAVMAAYDSGARAFGESRVQELEAKAAALPKDIEWHFIGHLQTNKIKKLLPLVTLIHGVDSWHLLSKIDEEACHEERVVNVLLEVKISHDAMKSGFAEQDIRQMLEEGAWRGLTHVRICGLMGVASNTDDKECIRGEFRHLHDLWQNIKHGYFADAQDFTVLSMGMTHDWQIAVEEGSTMIRIGHGIFGDTE